RDVALRGGDRGGDGDAGVLADQPDLGDELRLARPVPAASVDGLGHGVAADRPGVRDERVPRRADDLCAELPKPVAVVLGAGGTAVRIPDGVRAVAGPGGAHGAVDNQGKRVATPGCR